MLKAPEKPRKSFAPTHKGASSAGFSFALLDTNKFTPNQTGQTAPKKGVQLSPLARRARAKAWSYNATKALMAVTKSDIQRKRYARTLHCC